MQVRVSIAALLFLLSGCRRDSRTPIVLSSSHGRDLLGLREKTDEQKPPEVDISCSRAVT